MSIFNQLTFAALCTLCAGFVLTLIPLSFISIANRRALMQRATRVMNLESLQWTTRILLFIILSVFIDTLIRLNKLSNQASFQAHSEHDSISELQFKAKLFYTHRNMYLSLFTLVMAVVLWRRVLDVYEVLGAKLEIEELKREVSEMKLIAQKVEIDSTTESDIKHGSDKKDVKKRS